MALSAVSVEESGLLYLGMTESSLEVRNHFTHEHSGFSSFRRTLGALLKKELGLKVIPRGTGPSTSNIKNYRFAEFGEQRLSQWMKEHLSYSFAKIDIAQVSDIETRFIECMRPPLNLNKWKNPQAAVLKKLREACRNEAQQVVKCKAE